MTAVNKANAIPAAAGRGNLPTVSTGNIGEDPSESRVRGPATLEPLRSIIRQWIALGEMLLAGPGPLFKTAETDGRLLRTGRWLVEHLARR